MKRIILTKNLYIRSQRPHKQSPATGVLRKGKILPFLNRVKGQPLKGIDDWYEISPKEYIWGGGVAMASSYEPQSWKFFIHNPNVVQKATRLSEKIREMGLPILWDLYEAAPGPRKQVKVALLDTGVDGSNEFLKEKIADDKCFNARMNSPTAEAEGIENVPDTDGHGTFCAGLIAADKPPFVGAAYDCDLHIVKISRGRNFGIRKAFLDRAVDWCIAKGIEIISFSFSMRREIYEREGFESCVRRAREHGIVWVASIGNDPDSIRFPGGSSSCIGVGAIDAGTFIGTVHSTFLPQDFIYAPSVELMSPEFLSATLRAELPDPQGSSFATPIATGFVALVYALSSVKDPDTIKRILRENTIPHKKNALARTEYPVIHFENPVIV